MGFTPHGLEPFDPERNYLVARPILTNGVTIGADQPFDKRLVTTRRLRQLYEQRYLKMAPASPAPETLSDSDLRKWLEARGVIPRFGAARQKLLDLAAGVRDGLAA